MIYFVKCIQNNKSSINFDIANHKIVHKYFFKAFYRQTSNKKYKLQILKYKIHHTNIIFMQNNIFIAKILVKSSKKKEFITDMPDIEVIQICNATNMLLKYN